MPTRDPDPSSSIASPASGDASATLPVPYVPPKRRPVAEWLRWLFRRRNGEAETLRESLEDALLSGEAGRDTLSLKERTMLRNILGLRDLRVDDVMVPRADIVAVDLDTALGEALHIFQDAGHSRLPVYRETLDDPAGLLHVKDIMGYMLKAAGGRRSRRKTPMPAEALDFSKADLTKRIAQTKLVRDVLFVPPSMPAIDLLAKMQTTRTHMAIVIDEYGGTDGLISIEDLVESVVGDIEDEYDEDGRALIEPRGPHTFEADARASLDDVRDALGNGFEIGPDVAEDVDTLGGLVFLHAGHIPVRGELISFPGGYEIEVLDADPRRIKRMMIRKRPGQTSVQRALPERSGPDADAKDAGKDASASKDISVSKDVATPEEPESAKGAAAEQEASPETVKTEASDAEKPKGAEGPATDDAPASKRPDGRADAA